MAPWRIMKHSRRGRPGLAVSPPYPVACSWRYGAIIAGARERYADFARRAGAAASRVQRMGGGGVRPLSWAE